MVIRILVSFPLIFSFPVAAARATGPHRFKSPGGRFVVAFEELKHSRFTPEQSLKSADNISHVLYRISFLKAGQTIPVAEAEWHDVYGWTTDAKPTPPALLFRAILWSPNEDFAVLSSEGWASAPGTPERQAINLNPNHSWTTAPFILDEKAWADDFRVIGDSHQDCEYSVLEFGGRLGKTKSVKAAESPIGYEIARVTDRKVLIRKVLDNCRLENAESSFKSECTLLELDTMQTSPTTCP